MSSGSAIQTVRHSADTQGACPVCSSSLSQEVGLFSSILNLPGNNDSRVIRCRRCRALYLWPYICDELIHELYRESYFTGKAQDGGRLSIPGSSSDYESEFAATRVEKFAATIEMLKTYVPRATTVLDIGAATGEFLAVAQRHGLVPAGIEISSYAAAQAKRKYGFVFHETTLGDYSGTEKYDIIHLNHVFEHFIDPQKALSKVDALLAPSGVIYVEVPFQFSVPEILKYRLTGARKAFDVFSIHHPIFYTPRMLRRIFAEHGFFAREVRVFDWSRYPAASARGKLKRLMWFGASLFGQGLFIEAVFTRVSTQGR